MSAILDKSPWDSDEYSLYLLFLGASFSKFTCISLPPPPPPLPILYNVETWIYVFSVVCGVEGGDGRAN